MKTNDKKNKAKGIGKFILGAGVGAGLALLFAPKKGSELRADLKNKIADLINKAKEIDAEEVKQNLENKLEEIKKEIEDLDKEKVKEIAQKKAKCYNMNNNVNPIVSLFFISYSSYKFFL